MPALADRDEYRDNAARVAHQEQLRREVEERTVEHSIDYWVARFTELGLPAGPIRTLGESLDSEQTTALGLVVEAEHLSAGSYRTVRNPIRLDGAPLPVRGAPLLGEHTRELLLELGRSHSEVADLTERGVVWSSRAPA
jgi:formyl-CoA transferase